jgi:hypothetical protein
MEPRFEKLQRSGAGVRALGKGSPAISTTLCSPLSTGESAVQKILISLLAMICVSGSAIAESVTYVLETPGIV